MPLPKQGAFLIQAMILAALALNVPSSQVFDPFFQMAAAFFIFYDCVYIVIIQVVTF